MAETIIGQGEYEQGRFSCVTPDSVKVGWLFIERLRLTPGNDEAFARELFVKILDVRDDDGFPVIDLLHLEDDGRLIGTGEIVLDPDGIIVNDGWNEEGYLIGGKEPDDGPDITTKAELFAPAVYEGPRVYNIKSCTCLYRSSYYYK